MTAIPFPTLLLLACLPLAALAQPAGCGQPGQWLVPPLLKGDGDQPRAAVLKALDGKAVVLLGENHDRADDHRWQLEMLEALHRQQPDMAIGFEMFPRRVQPVLDRWVAGELDEAQFLKQSEWDQVWGFDARHYLPLFRFAREHKLPMLALNVDRELVKQVSSAGWAAVPPSRREGVGQPASPTDAYRRELRATFDQHPAPASGGPDAETRFARFMEAQLLWDRAMAEGIARYRQANPATRVVGILGAGHVRHGHGVPHQLRDLGQLSQARLITLPSDHACGDLPSGLADAVYLIPPQPDAFPPPRLGIAMKEGPDGVAIEKVMPDSLAERTGLKNGDVILQAAGVKVAAAEDVRGHVHRQPPGTWLPLLIRRGTENLEITVKFPPRPDPFPGTRP